MRRRLDLDPQVFLSVDPSSTSTGVCLWIRKWPRLTVSFKPRSKNAAERLVQIIYHVQMLGETRGISGIVCEQQFNNPERPAHSNLVLVQSIRSTCKEQGWWFKQIHVSQVRKRLDPQGLERKTSYKELIAEKVENTFNVNRFEKGDDELDAIAIGFAHLLGELEE